MSKKIRIFAIGRCSSLIVCKSKFFDISIYALLFLLIFGCSTISANEKNTRLVFNHLSTDDGLPQNSVYSIVKDKYGFMWFGTWGGAVRYDGYTFKTYRADENDPTALSSNVIKVIIKDKDQNIWIETSDVTYLYKYNYEKENFSRFPFKQAPTHVLQQLKKWSIRYFKNADNSYYHWEVTPQGLKQTDKTNGQSIIYQVNPALPFTLSDKIINYIYLDDSQNIWIGTQNRGVNFASLNIKPFTYYNQGYNGLADNVVRAIALDNAGNIWIGSEDKGLTIITKSENNTTCFYPGKAILKDLRVRSLFCDSKGRMWIGTNGGLTIYNLQTKKIKQYAGKGEGLCDSRIFSIKEDHEGTIWIGTLQGLMKYDESSDSFVPISNQLTGGKRIRDILEDRKHTIWIATDDSGLTKLQYTDKRFPITKIKSTRYFHREGVENSIVNNRISSLTEDLFGNIWIGTSSGLSILNPATGYFKNLTMKTGLIDDIIMSTVFDGKDHVWISHKKGITQIGIKKFDLQNFNTFDGLQGSEFCQNASYFDSLTGEMYFGGTNGMNSFNPDDTKLNQEKPRVVLTRLNVMNQTITPGLKLNNRVILENSIVCTDKLILSAKEETFSLEFSALHFSNPSSNKYKYKLEGYDKDWIYTDASMRVASYSYVPAGTYSFSVYAANSDGLWSDHPATIEITILPPWWLTWWSKLLYIIITVLVGWTIFEYVRSRIRLQNMLLTEQIKNEKNEELTNIKLKFFTEISHEFRTPLTLIIDPLEQLMTGNTDEEKTQYYYQIMNRNAKQLLSLINQLLDFRKLQSNRMEMKFVQSDLVSFVRNLATSFEIKASDQHIKFTTVTNIDSLEVAFDQNSVRKILYNLISNAFRFTPDYGEIIVRINYQTTTPDQITIDVQDSGVGIAPEHQDKIFDPFYQVSGAESNNRGSGLGLALTKELVLLHHGQIIVANNNGKGSCFKVTLPLRQETTVEEVSITEPVQIQSNPEFQSTEQVNKDDLPVMLIVDDNADIREYLSANFKAGFNILTAHDGIEGLSKAIETIPDIILSDVMMPGMDGMEFCKAIKTDERTSHIPVVLLTAKHSDETRIDGYETGADAYLTKPFNIQVLSSRIGNLLDQRMKLRALFTNGTPSELKKISTNITDQTFLDKVVALIEKNMEDSDFDPDRLATILKLSRSQLYRKLKGLTNQTVHDFMISIKMNKAKELLLTGDYTVAETAYRIGFTVPTNFSRTFSKHFGISPTRFLEMHKK